MSRARKRETPQHRAERNRRRLRAAAKRHAAGFHRRGRAQALVLLARYSAEFRRAVRLCMQRIWARRLRTGKAL